MKVAFALVVALQLGCLADRTLPVDVDARTPCSSAADCPSGSVCPAVNKGAASFCVARDAKACGNGVQDPGEECDDGNLVDGDGCRSNCVLEKCGDGVVDVDRGEVCDDGNAVGGDGCSADCKKVETCGDKVVDVGEACDDGNNVGGDGCSADCKKIEVCGDGVVDVGEACDDSNTVSGDGCRGDCKKRELCGDTIVDANEDCDDGNANPADACGNSCHAVTWTAHVVTGLGPGGGDPLRTPFIGPIAIVDSTGRIFINDEIKLYALDEIDHRVTAIAGVGVFVDSGDGGPAAGAGIAANGMVVDGTGRFVLADQGNRVRAIETDGTIVTLAGNGVAGFSPDGTPAALAQLNNPADVALDGDGRIVIADHNNCRVRRIESDGTVATVAGDDCGAPNAIGARGIDIDAQGDIFVADDTRAVVWKIDPSGSQTVIAGILDEIAQTGGDGVATTIPLFDPFDVTVDAVSGTLLIVERSHDVIRSLSSDGTLTTIVGNGENGFAGDGGPALAAELNLPVHVERDRSGRLLIADQNNARVRAVDENGVITTLAGIGVPLDTPLTFPTTAGVDGNGQFFFVDFFDFPSVRRVAPDVHLLNPIVIGNGAEASVTPGAQALSTSVVFPRALAFDLENRLVFSDADRTIWRVDSDGTLTQLAGPTSSFPILDGTPALQAIGNQVAALAVGPDDLVYYAEPQAATVRRIEANGTVRTLVGDGTPGFVDDTDGLHAEIGGFIASLSFLPNGALLIVDHNNGRVRAFDLTANHITTIAGGSAEPPGTIDLVDGAPAIGAALGNIGGAQSDALGRIFVSMSNADFGVVRRVDVDGTMHTVAGTSATSPDHAGDGGLAIDGRMAKAGSLAVAGDGSFAFTDVDRLRVVDANGVIDTVDGAIFPGGTGALAEGALSDPVQLAFVDDNTMLSVGGHNGLVEETDFLASDSEFVVGHPTGIPIGADPFAVSGASRAKFAHAFVDAEGIVFDPATSVAYVADRGAGAIYRVHVASGGLASSTSDTVEVFAGVAGDRRHVDSTTPGEARFVGPAGLALSSDASELFVADADDDTVRAIDVSSGAASTTFGEAGLGGSLAGQLFAPTALVFGKDGALFVADTGNHRVVRLDGVSTSAVTASVVLGTGEAASSGDGAPASSFPVDAPRGMAFDSFGNLFVTSTRTVRLVTADANGDVDGTGAVITIYGELPRVTFPEDSTFCLSAISIDASDVVRVADACQGYLVELTR